MHVPRIRWLSVQVDNMTDYLHNIYEEDKKIITYSNSRFKALSDTHRKRVVFDVGDLVWAILTRDKFLVGCITSLKRGKLALTRCCRK
jgi:hypothetical protein